MSDQRCDLDLEENVRTRAYLLWESCGNKSASMDEYWFLAVERIAAEAMAAYPPVQAQRHP